MPGPYPLATLGPTITSAGITIPQFSDIYASLQASFQAIYGSDAYISPDSQDGQLLAIFAQAIYDCDAAAVAIFNSFNPAFAQGTQLSSLVRINGLTRDIATNSTVEVTITGNAFTVITNGIIQDTQGNLWNLPATVTIPIGGSIQVNATAQQVGAINIPENSANIIYTPQLGWASVNNPSNVSVPGAPIEDDAQLRIRQAQSVALPALTPLDSIYAALAQLPGVTRLSVYENPTAATDGNGVPSHSIAPIVAGGNLTQIAQTIEATKSPGTGTYGTTSEVVVDPSGFPVTINFFVLAEVPIYVIITLTSLAGFVGSTVTAIQNAIVAFLNGLNIGEDVYFSQLIGAASLVGTPLAATFNISFSTSYIGTAPSPASNADLVIAFNAAAEGILANIGVTVL